MTDPVERIRAAFRLNLEQQKKQAKDLLKAAKAGDASALTRFTAVMGDARDKPLGPGSLERDPISLKLADAQFVLARELQFSSWTELKSHIDSLDQARTAIEDKRHPPDAGSKTLHLRCGSDIRSTLVEAGFSGDFLEVSYPYCHGPVTSAPDHFEREARFIAGLAGKHMNVSYEDALTRRYEEERALAASAASYERIVLWMEHDCFDQLVLVRCLAQYASIETPPALELIGINHFPGRRADGVPIRFIGLGQLPTEAIRLLWDRRRSVSPEQLVLGKDAWEALVLDDPRPLAAMMRTGTPALPDLGRALHRFLQELPGIKDGLGVTERLILQILSEASVSLNRLFSLMTYERDPLFFATDLKLLEVVERMQNLTDPVLTRSAAGKQWEDVLSITDAGRAVLRGERDFLSLKPTPRWVGGVQIGPGHRDWRWDDAAQKPMSM